jgi:undecaprenyl-diphosphatase
MNIDADILLWINGHYAEWLDEVMWTVSQPRTWIWLYVLLVLLLIKKFRNWKIVLLALVAFAVAVGLSDFTTSGIIKPLVCRLRPTHEPAIDPLRLVRGYAGGLYGFCSGHAANTMAVALLFSLLYKDARVTVALMTWVALNCYSRMYLGVHYPSDILAGLIIGALWSVIAFVLLQRLVLTSPWLRADGKAARQGGS